MIEIPVYTAIRYMVSDWGGQLRGFNTRKEAERFIEDKPECCIDYIPKRKIQVEECPF